VKARVYVTLKAGVLDVQGKAVEGTLHRMGFEDMSGVRVGRYLELEVEGEQARSRLDDACRPEAATTPAAQGCRRWALASWGRSRSGARGGRWRAAGRRRRVGGRGAEATRAVEKAV
jgi:phosphoribosylformylglycinamidine synthase PurS subunit